MIAPIVRELVRYILPALSPASWSSRMICAGRCIGPPNGDEGSAKHQWEGAMNVYTIVLERIGTGEPSLSIVTRQDTEEAARAAHWGRGSLIHNCRTGREWITLSTKASRASVKPTELSP
jgi:hypothetical protein